MRKTTWPRYKIFIQVYCVCLLCIVLSAIFTILQNKVSYVKSTIDGRYYLVRNLTDKQQAANTLAHLRQNMITLKTELLTHISSKYSSFTPYIQQLNTRMQDTKIMEKLDNDDTTSYSINKGQEIVFCVRSKDPSHPNRIHDVNLVMYVALHEMAHVACPEYGHTELFKKIFEFFTVVATNIRVYKPIHFKETPTEYCGMVINNSITA